MRVGPPRYRLAILSPDQFPESCVKCQKISPGSYLLGQMGADINGVVGDHSKPDPAQDAVRPPVERSPQSMPALENTAAAFTTGAPFLKFLEPTLLLPLL